MLSLRIKGSRPIPPGSPGGSGATPLRGARMHLPAKDWAEPEHALSLCSGLGGSLRPRAPNRQQPGPDPRARPQPERVLELECNAPRITTLSPPSVKARGLLSVAPTDGRAALSPTPPTKSHRWHDTRRQVPALALGVWEVSGPLVSAPSQSPLPPWKP